MPLAAMLRRFDARDRVRHAAVGAVLLVGGIAAWGIGVGDYRLTALMLGLVGAVAAVVVAVRWPYIFPYGVYAALVPLDNLLLLGSGGTLTKFLGMASGVALAASLLQKRRIVRPSRALWLWWAFIGWYALSLLWSQDAAAGERVAVQMASIVLLFSIVAIAPMEERELRAVCTYIVAGGIITAWYGIYLDHTTTVFYKSFESGRLYINVGDRAIDPNHFANSLLLPLALAIVGLLNARRPMSIVVRLGCCASIAAGITLTASREALLAAALILGTIVMLTRRRLLAAAIALGSVAAVPVFFPLVIVRMQEAVAQQGGGRNYLWHVEWLAFGQHPLFGWGAGSVITAYDQNYLAGFAPYIDHWGVSPHNTVLYIMVELGVVGIALWLAAVLGTYLPLQSIRRDDSLYDLRVAVSAAFVGLLFVALFIDLMDYKYLWLLLGTAVQLRAVARMRQARRLPAAAASAASTPPFPAYSRRRRMAL